MEELNPFIDMNKNKNDIDIVIPKFPRTHRLSIKISDETLARLQAIGTRYLLENTNKNPDLLSNLLELIGMYVLDIKPIEDVIDKESGISTQDCRQAGFADAKQGNTIVLLQLWGQYLSDSHQLAYMRGFMEGNFLRNKK